MFDSSILKDIPERIGVYAFYRRSRAGGKMTCAYVGMAGSEKTKSGLKTRLKQHLVEQTSTTCSRRNPAGVFVDRLTHVHVWIDDLMATREQAQAAELIVMEAESPLLRTEGGITPSARKLAKSPAFRRRVLAMIGRPTHVIELPGLDNTALLARDLMRRMELLEIRMKALERRVSVPRQGSATPAD